MKNKTRTITKITRRLTFLILILLIAVGAAATANAQCDSASFAPAVNYAAGDGATWVTMGDFNDDNILDLAVSNIDSNNVSVLLGNGDGTFQSNQNFAVRSYPRTVVMGENRVKTLIDK